LWWRYAEQGNGVALEFGYAAIAEYVQTTRQFAIIPMQYNRLQLLDATEFISELGLSLADEANGNARLIGESSDSRSRP